MLKQIFLLSIFILSAHSANAKLTKFSKLDFSIISTSSSSFIANEFWAQSEQGCDGNRYSLQMKLSSEYLNAQSKTSDFVAKVRFQMGDNSWTTSSNTLPLKVANGFLTVHNLTEGTNHQVELFNTVNGATTTIGGSGEFYCVDSYVMPDTLERLPIPTQVRALTGPYDNQGAGPTDEEIEAEGGVGQASGGYGGGSSGNDNENQVSSNRPYVPSYKDLPEKITSLVDWALELVDKPLPDPDSPIDIGYYNSGDGDESYQIAVGGQFFTVTPYHPNRSVVVTVQDRTPENTPSSTTTQSVEFYDSGIVHVLEYDNGVKVDETIFNINGPSLEASYQGEFTPGDGGNGATSSTSGDAPQPSYALGTEDQIAAIRLTNLKVVRYSNSAANVSWTKPAGNAIEKINLIWRSTRTAQVGRGSLSLGAVGGKTINGLIEGYFYLSVEVEGKDGSKYLVNFKPIKPYVYPGSASENTSYPILDGPTPTPTSSSDRPPSVTDAYGIRYSNTATEIYWRNPTNVGISKILVSRDTQLSEAVELSSGTNSLWVDNIPATQVRTFFSIWVVDNKGVRSAPTFVHVEMRN